MPKIISFTVNAVCVLFEPLFHQQQNLTLFHESEESAWQMPSFEVDSALLFTVFGNQVEPPLQEVNFFFSNIQRTILDGDDWLFLQVTKLFAQMVLVIHYSQSSNVLSFFVHGQHFHCVS